MKPYKYIVVPGYVRSKTDGQDHYISAHQLISLYGVNPEDCIVVTGAGANSVTSFDKIVLKPNCEGNYKIPEGEK